MSGTAHRPQLGLLSRLWLEEPDDALIARAVGELGVASAERSELALAYADLIILNVQPYGTLFTSESGELNGDDAQRAAALYESVDFGAAALRQTGAADHIGLALAFMSQHAPGGDANEVHWHVENIRTWAPVFCTAVSREPWAHEFYHHLANVTCDAVLSGIDASHNSVLLEASPEPVVESIDASHAEDAIRLHDLLAFFLTPGRSGFYLSRSRLGYMARAMGLQVPFGTRYQVAEGLFNAAGEGEVLPALLQLLESDVGAWRADYRDIAARFPGWRDTGDRWTERLDNSVRLISGMNATIAKAIATDSGHG